MNYLSKLNEQEIYRLCEAIPYDAAKFYFKKQPKQFAKICPGFRVQSLSETKVSSVLKKNYKHHFISCLLEDNLQRWIGEIEEAIEKESKNKTNFVAHVTILAVSYLKNNVSAYFKLVESEYADEQIKLIAEMVTEITEINERIEKLKKCVDEDQKAIEKLSSDLEKCEKENASKKKTEKEKKLLEKKMFKLEDELAQRKKEIENLKVATKKSEQEKQTVIAQSQNLKYQIKELEQQKSDLLTEISQGKFQKKLSFEDINNSGNTIVPIDKDEFTDILNSNLNNLGLNNEFAYPIMLSDFIYRGICCGRPFIIKKATAQNLIKCLSNTLTGNKAFDILSYESTITESDIIMFLQKSKRIVLLDNFIGNYNETLLTTILEKFKDKIVFLSTAYDGALRYVSNEFFEYVTYLSVSGIRCFEENGTLDEEPYVCDEAVVNVVLDANIHSKKIEKIISELYALDIRINGKRFVSDESSLAGFLYFSLFPYCKNVLKIDPFSHSTTLQKLVGENGRSPYKDLFTKWY